jgi:hypothetical protein
VRAARIIKAIVVAFRTDPELSKLSPSEQSDLLVAVATELVEATTHDASARLASALLLTCNGDTNLVNRELARAALTARRRTKTLPVPPGLLN